MNEADHNRQKAEEEARMKEARERYLEYERKRPKPLELRFSPYAWAKLLALRDFGDTEVGCFGVTPKGDSLFVEDVIMVKQKCTRVTVEFDDESVGNFLEDQVDRGRMPENCMRIWIHTHPGSSAQPSNTDEQTFFHCFGRCNWAVMFILAKGGETYCRLQVNGDMPVTKQLDDYVDYSTYEFNGSDTRAWAKEYSDNVTDLDALEQARWQATRDAIREAAFVRHDQRLSGGTFVTQSQAQVAAQPSKKAAKAKDRKERRLRQKSDAEMFIALGELFRAELLDENMLDDLLLSEDLEDFIEEYPGIVDKLALSPETSSVFAKYRRRNQPQGQDNLTIQEQLELQNQLMLEDQADAILSQADLDDEILAAELGDFDFSVPGFAHDAVRDTTGY